ncbi:LysR family transcriptional regulator [Oscillibacter sp.]|uniref:helix-turn-helix domain-containing protein n=1 Tax=Oscillibacter sp. TaxID=1945593 RepID=UPI0028A28E20|nr:LysR family transcriptional regulator [Oscillibacter sp.]
MRTEKQVRRLSDSIRQAADSTIPHLQFSGPQAAKALMSSQPNVTRCMNNLEEELSCRLMIRSNRGIVLTTEGE